MGGKNLFGVFENFFFSLIVEWVDFLEKNSNLMSLKYPIFISKFPFVLTAHFFISSLMAYSNFSISFGRYKKSILTTRCMLSSVESVLWLVIPRRALLQDALHIENFRRYSDLHNILLVHHKIQDAGEYLKTHYYPFKMLLNNLWIAIRTHGLTFFLC